MGAKIKSPAGASCAYLENKFLLCIHPENEKSNDYILMIDLRILHEHFKKMIAR
jgi:hypothetical protein